MAERNPFEETELRKPYSPRPTTVPSQALADQIHASVDRNPFEELPEMQVTSLDPVFQARASMPVQTSLDEALEIVAAHLESGQKFTNAQLDLCTKVIATQLPDGDRDMLREISETQGFPLWICLLAQWRRCCEYAEQFSVLPDPDWIEKMERD